MEVVHERCCGLDVHKKSVVACVLTPKHRETRTFETTTRQLLVLAEWLQSLQVTAVAMESTGVFWKPVHNVLEHYGFELLVINAHHIKKVPGRKTDVSDAEWIADLLRHGLVRGSFIPKREDRELRELLRYRKSLVEDRTSEINRVQKVLEGANIKLSSVVTNVLGVSGRQMLEAMIAGNNDPIELAAMAKRKLRSKTPQLEEALHGVMTEHQRMMLRNLLDHVDFLDDKIERLSEEVETRLRPFRGQIELLVTVPGWGFRTAELFMGVVGKNIDRFPTAGNLASWVAICPGQNESAGKRKSGRTRKGNQLLRTALVEASWGASRTLNTYVRALYYRIKARGGAKKAAVAVAHHQLVAAYHILKKGVPYQELGANYFDQRDKDRAIKRAVARIEKLGYKVSLSEAA